MPSSTLSPRSKVRCPHAFHILTCQKVNFTSFGLSTCALWARPLLEFISLMQQERFEAKSLTSTSTSSCISRDRQNLSLQQYHMNFALHLVAPFSSSSKSYNYFGLKAPKMTKAKSAWQKVSSRIILKLITTLSLSRAS